MAGLHGDFVVRPAVLASGDAIVPATVLGHRQMGIPALEKVYPTRFVQTFNAMVYIFPISKFHWHSYTPCCSGDKA